MRISGSAAGRWRVERCAQTALLVVAAYLVVPLGVRAQIDPLVYAGVRNSTRASVTLGHTFDAAYVSPDGRVWRTSEEALQITLERPLTRTLSATLSLAGSHRSEQVDGEPRRDAWGVDQLSVGMATSLERPRLGDQRMVSLETLLPLQSSGGAVAYLVEATTVWLLDPVAIEIVGSVAAGPQLPLSMDLSAGLTFLVNRHLSLVGRFDLHDLRGELPTASFSFTTYRHPIRPGDPLWGWGLIHSVEAGRTLPGVHLLLGLEW